MGRPSRTGEPQERITVWLAEAERDYLDSLAGTRSISRSELIRRLLRAVKPSDGLGEAEMEQRRLYQAIQGLQK